jgi:hypothetical protein
MQETGCELYLPVERECAYFPKLHLHLTKRAIAL